MSTCSINKAIIIGRLGRDPEIRYTASGTPMASFSVATSERKVENGTATISKTEWHNIVAWSRLAENCEKYLKKGSLVYVEGRIQTREWENQRSGTKCKALEIVAQVVQFLDTREESGNGKSQGGLYDEDPGGAPQDDYSDGIFNDDIPF